MESCPSRISTYMTPTTYLQSKLDELKGNATPSKKFEPNELKAEIFRLLASKKFRKYSVTPEFAAHIQEAISLCVDRNEPIKLELTFGCYKLWRLEETPEADWAELFTLMHYTNWLKPICAIYKPGVWVDFFSDDVIVPRMNSIDPAETLAYRTSLTNLINFIKKYIPSNLNFTLTRVIDQYQDQEEFEIDLQEQTKKLTSELSCALPVIDEKMAAMIDLNVRASETQKKDKNWRQKVYLLHEAYRNIKYRRSYYKRPDKIMIFPYKVFECLAVGTTKRSIAKFWCGVGVLEKDEENYHQLVLTPSQIDKNKFEKVEINIKDLKGKNFKTIKIMELQSIES